VTGLLLTGMTTADIAQELWITPETLRGHVKAIFAKMGVGSRAELFARLSHEPPVRSARGS
jgi:DNA-binding CsgD family transcriptional regulator